MATFRNCSNETLSVFWTGQHLSAGPDETIEIPDLIADDPETTFGDRWVRVDTKPKTKSS